MRTISIKKFIHVAGRGDGDRRIRVRSLKCANVSRFGLGAAFALERGNFSVLHFQKIHFVLSARAPEENFRSVASEGMKLEALREE